jgi:hypothetical protein
VKIADNYGVFVILFSKIAKNVRICLDNYAPNVQATVWAKLEAGNLSGRIVSAFSAIEFTTKNLYN